MLAAIHATPLMDYKNTKGMLTINDLELAAYISHLHIFAPHMAPLEHITTVVDSTAAKSWAQRGNVSTTTVIGPCPPQNCMDHAAIQDPRVHYVHNRNQKH